MTDVVVGEGAEVCAGGHKMAEELRVEFVPFNIHACSHQFFHAALP